MKALLFVLSGMILSVACPLFGQDVAPKAEPVRQNKEQERKAYQAELAKMYKAVPTAAKLEKGGNELLAVLLTVEDAASASAAATRIKAMDKDSKALEQSFRNELAAYGAGKSRTDLGLRTLMGTIKKQGNDIMAILESIHTQGNMTKELSTALNAGNAFKPVAACPAMSEGLTGYWKREFSYWNRLNRVLFSLQEKKDISRVEGELKVLRAERGEIRKMQESLLPLKVETDAAGNAEMSRRLQKGPIRVLNHILSVVDARGFIGSSDPDVQKISSQIGEMTR